MFVLLLQISDVYSGPETFHVWFSSLHDLCERPGETGLQLIPGWRRSLSIPQPHRGPVLMDAGRVDVSAEDEGRFSPRWTEERTEALMVWVRICAPPGSDFSESSPGISPPLKSHT